MLAEAIQKLWLLEEKIFSPSSQEGDGPVSALFTETNLCLQPRLFERFQAPVGRSSACMEAGLCFAQERKEPKIQVTSGLIRCSFKLVRQSTTNENKSCQSRVKS